MKKHARWIPIAIAVLIVLLIVAMQRREISGTFTVFPGQNTDGPVTISGVTGNESWTFIRPIVTIDTPRRVKFASIIVNATGIGSISAISNSQTVTLWDSNWVGYSKQAQIGSVLIETRNLTVDSAFDTGSPEFWLLANVPKGTTISDPDRLLNWSAFVNTATPSRGAQNLSYQLRGNHRLVVYGNDTLTIGIAKQDFNMYAGSDELVLTLTDLVSGAKQNATIGDDGFANLTKAAKAVKSNATFTNLSDSIYELRLTSASNGSDFNYNLSFSNGPILFMQQIFPLAPVNLSVLCSQACTLKAITSHDYSLQTIKIDNKSLTITNRSVIYNITLPAGTHRVSMPKGDVVLSGFNQAAVDGNTWTPYVFNNADNGTVLVRNDPTIIVNQAGFKAIVTLKATGNVSVDAIELMLS